MLRKALKRFSYERMTSKPLILLCDERELILTPCVCG